MFAFLNRAKLKTKCFKNGELVVLDGEAMAILPSLLVARPIEVASSF